MSKIELRDYQVKGINMLYDAIREGHKKILWCFPTGAGKSTICSKFVKVCVKNQKRILFMVHSKELVTQFAQRLSSQFKVPSGIIMAGVKSELNKAVQVASVQTLVRRSKPEADVVIIDETHRAKAKTYTKILEFYPDAIIIGLTATPFRADGKGLKGIFETIVHPIKISELIKRRFLTGTKVYAPKESVDMTGVKIVAGDYNKKQMYEKFNDGAIKRGVVDNYLKYAKGKKAIVFNCNVEHSKEQNERFLKAGIKSAHLDGATSKEERTKIVNEFAQGKINVLNNVYLFVEGFDVPDTECVILNKATKSLNAYIQMVGRGLRPSEGKKHCIVLDHGGNTIEHGFVEDYDRIKFSLEGVKKKKGQGLKNKICKSCQTVNKIFAIECIECGKEFKRKELALTFGEDVEFTLLDRNAVIVERLLKLPYKRVVGKIPLSQLRIYQMLKDFKQGWWFHSAIDNDYVPKSINKESPRAWEEVKMLIELAEVNDGVHELYLKIKEMKNGKVQRA